MKQQRTKKINNTKSRTKNIKHHPRKIISIILIATFVPFAIWSLMEKRFTLFFIVALIIYFGQRGMNKIWPINGNNNQAEIIDIKKEDEKKK